MYIRVILWSLFTIALTIIFVSSGSSSVGLCLVAGGTALVGLLCLGSVWAYRRGAEGVGLAGSTLAFLLSLVIYGVCHRLFAVPAYPCLPAVLHLLHCMVAPSRGVQLIVGIACMVVPSVCLPGEFLLPVPIAATLFSVFFPVACKLPVGIGAVVPISGQSLTGSGRSVLENMSASGGSSHLLHDLPISPLEIAEGSGLSGVGVRPRGASVLTIPGGLPGISYCFDVPPRCIHDPGTSEVSQLLTNGRPNPGSGCFALSHSASAGVSVNPLAVEAAKAQRDGSHSEQVLHLSEVQPAAPEDNSVPSGVVHDSCNAISSATAWLVNPQEWPHPEERSFVPRSCSLPSLTPLATKMTVAGVSSPVAVAEMGSPALPDGPKVGTVSRETSLNGMAGDDVATTHPLHPQNADVVLHGSPDQDPSFTLTRQSLQNAAKDAKMTMTSKVLRWMLPQPGPGQTAEIPHELTDLSGSRDVEMASDMGTSGFLDDAASLASISHDVRTPLTTALSVLQILMEGDGMEEEDRKDLLRKAWGALQHAVALVNNLLDMSKLRGARMKVVPKRVSVRRLAVEVLRMLEVQALQRKTELLLNVTPNVPSCVLCDRVLLHRVLTNLVTNALKFCDGGRVTLNADWSSVEGKLLIVVADTGIGMT
eukprot:RCo053761